MAGIHNGLQKLRPVNTDDLLSARARNYGYYPLIKGNNAPHFYLPVENRISQKQLHTPFGRETHLPVEDYLDRPLVLTFFSAAGNFSTHIKNLESLRADIKVMGGKLIVLTSITPRYLKKALTNYEDLIIFYDRDNQAAELFGLFDAVNPIWQWVSGIEDENIAMPAFYVISAERQIVYHHIDYSMALYANNNYYAMPFIRELLTAVYNTGQQQAYQPLAYKSVS